ncbi:hypothetical protein FWF48_03360 [Candidatus Saccharibacteria bacterium]|nr:hypothetical protein [Candidatus Saccharibacteria bacterium]
MALRKRVNKRKLLAPIIAAAALVLSGIVYAAASGYLSFGGSVGRNANCKLNIESAINVDSTTTTLYQSDPTITATVDGATRETMNFSTNLDYQAPAKEITFQVVNVGTCYQELGALEILSSPSNGVVVNWPSLDGIQLPPESSTGAMTISVQWTSVPSSQTTETMSARISYSEYAPN